MDVEMDLDQIIEIARQAIAMRDSLPADSVAVVDEHCVPLVAMYDGEIPPDGEAFTTHLAAVMAHAAADVSAILERVGLAVGGADADPITQRARELAQAWAADQERPESPIH